MASIRKVFSKTMRKLMKITLPEIFSFCQEGMGLILSLEEAQATPFPNIQFPGFILGSKLQRSPVGISIRRRVLYISVRNVCLQWFSLFQKIPGASYRYQMKVHQNFNVILMYFQLISVRCIVGCFQHPKQLQVTTTQTSGLTIRWK